MSRHAWLRLDDAALLADCAVDTYRASGPGGQKRNKTSSAVRLRHLPSGLRVIAEESRSQHENRAKALRRLRREMVLGLREPFDPGPGTLPPEIAAILSSGGRLVVGRKDARYWPAVAIVLDALFVLEGRVAETAAGWGVTTANLVDLLRLEPRVWQRVNEMRQAFGLKPLH